MTHRELQGGLFARHVRAAGSMIASACFSLLSKVLTLFGFAEPAFTTRRALQILRFCLFCPVTLP
jgi:hypothetical protein